MWALVTQRQLPACPITNMNQLPHAWAPAGDDGCLSRIVNMICPRSHTSRHHHSLRQPTTWQAGPVSHHQRGNQTGSSGGKRNERIPRRTKSQILQNRSVSDVKLALHGAARGYQARGSRATGRGKARRGVPMRNPDTAMQLPSRTLLLRRGIGVYLTRLARHMLHESSSIVDKPGRPASTTPPSP